MKGDKLDVLRVENARLTALLESHGIDWRAPQTEPPFWIFFSSRVPARDARRLGTAILSHTCNSTRQLELGSYDRLFPNQDTIPKGGFGNLIVLPLQKTPRERNCSVFVNNEFQPYSDQWAFLALIQPMNIQDIEPAILLATGNIPSFDISFISDEDLKEPWKRSDKNSKNLTDLMPLTNLKEFNCNEST